MTNSDPTTNPQVLRTQKLMLDAARVLLADHGPEGVTHLRVASESGVARATVYRHWPDRAAILLDLLRSIANLDLSKSPPDSPITERVTAVIRTFAGALNGDGGRTLAAMIGLAEWDEDVFAALGRMASFGPMFLRKVLSDAIEQGFLDSEADPALLADRLIGPLFFRRFLYHEDIEDGYVDRLVTATLGPHLAS